MQMLSGTRCAGQIARIVADQQHRAFAQLLGGQRALLVEVAGVEHRRRAECEDQWRRPGLKECLQLRRQVHLAGVAVVEEESGGPGARLASRVVARQLPARTAPIPSRSKTWRRRWDRRRAAGRALRAGHRSAPTIPG